MNFSTYCDNKGCRKLMTPVVDKVTLDAYCTECNQKVNSIHIFMRRQMFASGMIKKDIKSKLAWSVTCDKCKNSGTPNIKNNKPVCFSCDKELDKLSKPFVEALKTGIKNKT